MPKVRLRLTRSQSQDDIVSQACDLLGQQIALNDLRLADVAMRSGMTRTRIKVLLDRRSNPKIRDLAAIAHALGGKLALQLIQSEVGVV